jgi:hypothetical protein
MANFRVWSLPDLGGLLLGAAWLMGPIVAALDGLDRARRGAISRSTTTAA